MSRVFMIVLSLFAQMDTAAPAPHGLSFQATLESIKIDAQPRQVVTRQFNLTLDANQPATRFRSKVEDWWRSEDGKQSFYAEPGTLRSSCAPWVALNPVEATAKPGEPLRIRITVTVPAEIRAGGYWCALTVDEIPDPAADQVGVGVKFVASVSTGIFVNVGATTRAARILDLQLAGEDVVVRVRNEGNGPLGIDGRLEFYQGASTSPVAVITLSRATILTEPSLEGRLAGRLPAASDLPAGRYRVRAVLDFGGPNLLGAEKELDVVRSGVVNAQTR